jgi:hypothetical protein
VEVQKVGLVQSVLEDGGRALGSRGGLVIASADERLGRVQSGEGESLLRDGGVDANVNSVLEALGCDVLA